MFRNFFKKKEESKLEKLVKEFINSSIPNSRKKYPVLIQNICDLNMARMLSENGLLYTEKDLKKAKEIALKYIRSLGFIPQVVSYTHYLGVWVVEFKF